MALTLSYSVTNLKVKDEVNSEGVTLQNAVCQTYWKCVGEDESGNTGEFVGATPFSAATVPSANFVDFADLQESDVIGWISAVVEADAGYKAHIEAQIQRQIDQESQRDATMPWASEDVTPPLPEDAPDPTPADPEA
jgi:hypothetical protein